MVDNRASDGGTALVPRFHKCYKAWSAALGAWEHNRVGQRRRGNAFIFSNPHDPIHGLMRRVTLRAGSLLLWNQCTAHGAVPNSSDRLRVAQFVRGFRAGEMSRERAKARAAALARHLHEAGSLGALTPLAPHVFGLPSELDAQPYKDKEPSRVDWNDGDELLLVAETPVAAPVVAVQCCEAVCKVDPEQPGELNHTVGSSSSGGSSSNTALVVSGDDEVSICVP